MKRIDKHIGDKGFLSLLRKFLEAGYIDAVSGKVIKTDCGAPQGGILSPILSNIVLHELDQYMENQKKSLDKGKKRR